MFKSLFKKKSTLNTEKDLLILTSGNCSLPLTIKDDKYILSFQYIASVDLKTNTYSKEKGSICYVFDKSSDADSRIKATINQFENFELYHVKCDGEAEALLGTSFMVSEVCESGSMVIHPELEALQREYRNPVQIEHELGIFTWNIDFKYYMGTIDWLGAPCSVILNCGGVSDEARALQALEQFKAVYNKRESCNRNLKEYGMRKLKERNKEATSELALTTIDVSWDGNFYFQFSCGKALNLKVYYKQEEKMYGALVYDLLHYDEKNMTQIEWETYNCPL